MTFMTTAMRAALATVVAAGIGTAAMAQEVTLKMHQFLPPQANVPKLILQPWADRIMEASDGRIKIDHYPAMQLGGKPPELAGQVTDGVADIIWTVAGYTPGRFPQAEVFELPFMMTNAEDTSRAFWQYAEANMMDSDFSDIKVLGVWVHGPGVIHSSTPVNEIADLNGLKVRGPTRVITGMLTDLGATAVGLPVPAIPEALSKGVIDACVIPWEVTAALKVPELVQNHTVFGGEALYTTAFIFAMNKDKYESLPDDLKAIIDEHTGEDFSAMAGKLQAGADVPSRQLAEDMGNNIIDLSPEQVAEWKEAASGSEAKWIAEMDEKGFDGQALVDQARELIEKNTAD
ncbi:TRAP transporter substrate-binding protein [Roseovarius indicus]|uniref:C4-dicarboxylate ABC transporter n=1 Tax=Roseovarius indicus TaxID=540747 RepID=A0A0T5P225_9RHOB|nr:C4-dicarboxylate ABC transporter [Roseovarius indicus]OAO09760.1 C4-dicarboxylate ABC transporter [Roseovarius indicus]QEW24780.1 Neu5Ac-binding protein [Roseovarius indicus]SFE51670.1 TRAP-type C4-dicarboxylate transport system, substrate-binding protein [Roseovarius indicus]